MSRGAVALQPCYYCTASRLGCPCARTQDDRICRIGVSECLQPFPCTLYSRLMKLVVFIGRLLWTSPSVIEAGPHMCTSLRSRFNDAMSAGTMLTSRGCASLMWVGSIPRYPRQSIVLELHSPRLGGTRNNQEWRLTARYHGCRYPVVFLSI